MRIYFLLTLSVLALSMNSIYSMDFSQKDFAAFQATLSKLLPEQNEPAREENMLEVALSALNLDGIIEQPRIAQTIHSCDLCGFQSYQQESFSEHITQCRQVSFSCALCNRSFSEIRKLKRHISIAHPTPKTTDTHTCKGCNKEINSDSFAEHRDTCEPYKLWYAQWLKEWEAKQTQQQKRYREDEDNRAAKQDAERQRKVQILKNAYYANLAKKAQSNH